MSDYTDEFPYHLLPQELVFKILLKLPSKSLITFKSVCKSWHSQITNPQFFTKHLLPDRDNDSNLLLAMRRDKTNKEYIYSLLSNQSLEERYEPRSLPYPELPAVSVCIDSDDSANEIKILGSCCNGLVCLYDNEVGYIVLWNLGSRDLKILPDSNVPNPQEGIPYKHHLGFGYDANTNDYKVIRVTGLRYEESYEPCSFHKVEIYSLKADCWRGTNIVDGVELPANFCYVPDHMYTAYVNGVFLWWARSNDDNDDDDDDDDDDGNMIMWFRMSDELFGTTKLPANAYSDAAKFDHSSKHTRDGDGDGDDADKSTDHLLELLLGEDSNVPTWTKNFLVLNDHSITLVVFDYREMEEKCFHVWVLLEFDVAESWTKLFVVGPLANINRPIWFWKNGKMIMENNDGDMVLCDPFAEEIEFLNISGFSESLQIISIEEKYLSSHKQDTI